MFFHRRARKTSPEAEAAKQDATKTLHIIQQRTAEVHEIAEASRKFRRENHFADSLKELFEQGGPPHAT